MDEAKKYKAQHAKKDDARDAIEDKKLEVEEKEVSYAFDKKVKDDESDRRKEEIKVRINAIWAGFTKKRLIIITGALVVLTAAIYIFKYGLPYVIKLIFVKEPKIISFSEFGNKVTIRKLPTPILSPKLHKKINNDIRNDKARIKINKINPGLYKYSHLLFYGPAGTGKTLVAQYYSQKAGFQRIEIKGNSFRQKDNKDAVRSMKEIFAFALAMARKYKRPVLIFIDEVDAVCPKRGTGSQLNNELTTIILAEMEKAYHHQIKLIFTTNLPNNIDPALKSRLEGLEFPNPTAQERVKLFKNELTYNRKLKVRIDSAIHTQKELIAERMEGLNGRDINALMTRLLENAALSGKKRLSLDSLLHAIEEKKLQIKNAKKGYLNE